MGFRWKKKALLFKTELTPGTDAVPTGSANAVQAINCQITPLAGQSVERGIETPYFGHTGEIQVGTHVMLTFQTELAGSGAAATPPAWGPILRACGAAETVDVGVDVTYNPITDSQESATIYFYIANSLHKMTYCRGTGRLVLEVNGLPRIEWTFTGLYVGPVTGAAPAVTLTAWKAPVPASDANTTTFELHGFAPIGEAFTLDIGNDVQGRFLIGQESVEIVDRRSTGEMRFESPNISTKDFFAAATGHVLDDLSIVHGVTAGNIIEIAAPKVQIGRPAYNNVQGIVHMAVPLIFQPDSGNDEWSIVTK